jgi:molybdopterin synthase catalytic subunit
MADTRFDIAVPDTPLAIPTATFEPHAGAVVDFFGVVRGLENDEPIAGIDYEAHREMAEYQLAKIAAEAREKFGCEKITLHHRVGFVPVAEPSLFLRVTARHRQPAFAAAQWIVEQLKALAPIWKHPARA